MIKLGSRVRDPISGFEGIAVGRFEWLYGCVRMSVESEVLKDGKPIEQTFDENRLEVLVEGVHTGAWRDHLPLAPPAPLRTGTGGGPDPVRSDPSR